MKGYKQLNQE